jgi:hypothetical protein
MNKMKTISIGFMHEWKKSDKSLDKLLQNYNTIR